MYRYTFTTPMKIYLPLLLYYYYYLVLVGIFFSSSSFQKNTIFSSISAHAYVINIYNQVAYNSYPAGFGKEIPKKFHNGAFVNLFLPPKNVPWDLCNVDDFLVGGGIGGGGQPQQRRVQDASSSLKTNHNRHLKNKEWSDVDTGATPTFVKPYSSVLLPKDEEHNGDDDNNNDNDATIVDVSQFIDKCPKRGKPSYERSIMTFGIQRSSMAMLIMRGGCTFYTKAVNALKLNSYFAIVDAEIQESPSGNTTTHVVDMDSSHSHFNGTNNGTTLGIRPKIEYLIIMNHNGHKRSNRTFPIRKDGAEPDLDDIGLVSLGYSNGMHLLCSMVEKNDVDNGGGQDSSSSIGQQETLGTDMFLDSIAFLPLESDQRTSRDWTFPVNIDGMTADHGSMKNKLLLIFIFVTLLFPIARMILFCCMHHREFQWRRNSNGRIIGFTWSRRAVELDNGSWIESFVAGRNGTNGERGPILLSQEGVKKLPMIEFGVDSVQEIVARYRSNDDDKKKNDNGRGDEKDKKRLHEENNDIDKYDDDDDHVESQDIKTEKDLIVAAYDSCLTCSICICDFEHGEKLRLLPECGHVFHTECIMPWLTGKKNACPLCQRRVKVSEEDIRQGDDDDAVQQWRIATSLMSGPIEQDRSPVNVSGSFEQSDTLRRDSTEELNSSVSTLDLSSRGHYPQDDNSIGALSSSRRDLTIFP